MNLLYCLDENYNKQAFISIMSLIKNNSPGLCIHIIHQDPDTFEKYRKTLSEFNNSKIFLYRFENKENVEFPLGVSDHISEATYYRIFIEQHLPNDIDEILYIDPDVVCINNIEKITNEIFKKKLFSKCKIKNVVNYYGLIEQTGSIFIECPTCNSFLTSSYSEVLIRDKNFNIINNGSKGLIQLLSLIPTSYPGHNIITEDIGSIVVKKDNCKMNVKHFLVHGRAKQSENRGCSDV